MFHARLPDGNSVYLLYLSSEGPIPALSEVEVFALLPYYVYCLVAGAGFEPARNLLHLVLSDAHRLTLPYAPRGLCQVRATRGGVERRGLFPALN